METELNLDNYEGLIRPDKQLYLPSRKELIRDSGKLALGLGVAGGLAMNMPPALAAPSYSRKFVAFFVFPSSNVKVNSAKFREMKADAVTFGHRVVPTSIETFPWLVQEELRRQGYNRIFRYGGRISWDNTRYYRNPIRIGNVSYDPIPMPDSRAVVVTQNNGDSQGALVKAAKETGSRVVLGLPQPQRKHNQTYMPDLSYLDVIEHFTYRFVDEYARQGAHGFYQSFEMPLTDNSFWSPMRDLYRLQFKVANWARPGVMTLVSPYLDSRVGVAGSLRPSQMFGATQQLLGTAAGTNLLIAPQDGLGTGKMAMSYGNRAGKHAPLENYLKEIQRAAGHRTYTVLEGFSPGDGTALGRGRIDPGLASKHLWTEGSYSRGSIGYAWDRVPNSKIDFSMKLLGPNEFSAGNSTI